MPRPIKAELISYNVYFGDCFLLLFHYVDGSQRSVLIDFGSTGKGTAEHGAGIDDDERYSDSTGTRLLKVAEDIKGRTKGKLNVVVATHRHKDHIYGFGLKKPGEIILALEPDLIIQPWTEDPENNADLTNKEHFIDPEIFKSKSMTHFAEMLDDMQEVAEVIELEARQLGNKEFFQKTIDKKLRDRIVFAADDSKKIKNLAAVRNLQAMGEREGSKPHYVFYGYDQVDWESILPGINVRILGPPRLEDYPEITTATNTSDEFWIRMGMNKFFWGVLAANNNVATDGQRERRPIFRKEKAVQSEKKPANLRWFIRRLRNVRAEQLLGIVRFVDRALNNTSVILLFEVGDQKMLFPGDAQIENWQFLLDAADKDPELKDVLESTTLYKVGHHGSRNANPKSLWKDFKNRSKQETKKARLNTVVSTMAGKHGESEDTAVPLDRMVMAMKAETNFSTLR